MALPPVVALDIGTSRVVALVGEIREDGNVMITGMGEHPSVGLRKGEVVDIENAAFCVRSAISMAEESSKVTIRQVHLALSGGHIQSVVSRGGVPVMDKNGEITGDDVEQVMEVARATNLPPDRESIHTICQHFCIDGQQRVRKPEGMNGSHLAVDMLVLHGVRNRLRNTVKVVRSIPLEVADVVFGGLCSSLSVLTVEQRKSGAAVIDLGAGTTDYAVYADNILADAGVLGVGGDHVTNDITIAFNISNKRAEILKKENGSAMIDGAISSQRISLPSEVGFQSRTVSLQSLQTVINARMDEVFSAIRDRLDHAGVLHQLGAGIVLTGAGANLVGVARLAERVFGLPCHVGRPLGISGLARATDGPEYATSSGLIHYAFMTMKEREEGSSIAGIFRKLFKF